MLKIALIVGTTRPGRFADTPVTWLLEGARERTDFQIDVLDLRDYPLPFYEEAILPPYNGGVYSNPAAEAWRKVIGTYDGYIISAAEYNHSMSAVVKNALDSATFEWHRKPVAFLGYGAVGAARAIEQLRGVAIELHMAPIKHEVNIAMEPMLGVMRGGKSLNDYPYLADSRTAMFDSLVWWGNALRNAREGALTAS
ncbi:MAG: NADPH-dependent FMN reductase [Gemmatimonas sp.]